MPIHFLDPLRDPRWSALAQDHPRATVFHETAWLRALAETYKYPCFAVTTSPPEEPLQDGIAFCEIESWLTGTRAVSLPFSDHAEPLLGSNSDILDLQRWVPLACRHCNWQHIEMRTLDGGQRAYDAGVVKERYLLHLLDLSPSSQDLFRNLHRDSMQRRIRHADRAGLQYERGSSTPLLAAFYKLLVRTRGRHGIPPQPRAWFKALMAEFGPRAEIRVAKKDDVPIAAMLTLRHGATVVYKYGCSDERFHSLGGVPFLFWKLIEESKCEDFALIDLGRTDLKNESLARFKDHLGARRTNLAYLRYPLGNHSDRDAAAVTKLVRRLSAVVPHSLLSAVGSRLYRHAG